MNDTLIRYIEEELLGGEQSIAAEDDLLSSGLVDSLAIMRLISFIEQEYSIKVPPQDMTIEHFISVDAISNYIKSVKVS